MSDAGLAIPAAHARAAPVPDLAADRADNAGFWHRFGGRPDCAGQTILDVGCGFGALIVDLAASGAALAVGVDIDAERIDFARRHVADAYPELAPRIRFECGELARLDAVPTFDTVVSRNTFEHVLDLPGLLGDIAARLKPGGRLLAGFGPLYRAPWGDHRRTAMGWLGPWGHLLLPERWIIARLNRLRHRTGREPVARIEDLGLNRWDVADYRRCFAASGLRVVRLATNAVGRRAPHRRIIGAVVRRMVALPFLESLFTLNIYAVLEQPDRHDRQRAR